MYTLEQLLALVRAGATPEARNAALQGLTPTQRQQAFSVAKERGIALQANQNRTGDEHAEMMLLSETVESLGRMIREETTAANRFSAATQLENEPAFRFTPFPTVREGGAADEPTGHNQQPQPQQRTILTVGGQERRGQIFRTPGERAGTDLVEMSLDGNRRVDFEGWGVSERQFMAICEPSYERAFVEYLRRGAEAGTTVLRSLQEGIDVQGGYLVPPQWIADIIGPDPMDSGLMDLVTTQTMVSDKIQWPTNTWSKDNANDIYTNSFRKQRTGETGAPTDIGQPSFGQVEIEVFEGSMEVALTRSMMSDSGVDVGGYTRTELRTSFRLDTESEIAVGDGNNKPAGIMRNPGGNANEPPSINVGNPVTADGLVDWFYQTPRQYRNRGQAVMNDTNVYRTWAKLKDTDGSYIFGLNKTTDGGLATPRGEVFLGKPIVFCPFYADSGANAFVASLGDHKRAYYYGLRLGMSIEVQMLPRDAFAYIVLRFRDGGKVVQPRALRIAKQA